MTDKPLLATIEAVLKFHPGVEQGRGCECAEQQVGWAKAVGGVGLNYR